MAEMSTVSKSESSTSESAAESIGEWKKDKVLGSGGFGIVVLWRNKDTNEAIALKQITAGNACIVTDKNKERWKLEVAIMHRLSHPNVVAAMAVPKEISDSVNAGSEFPLLAMEYCVGGDLRKILNRPENCHGLSEPEVRTIALHISSAVEYLHSMRIIHRDLKPENIVLQETDGKTIYKLTDLGYAKQLDQSSLCNSFVGTLQYLAPELFTNDKYTSTVDYWSFGILMHECITGIRPFLPNLSPAQWIPIVMNKNSDNISATKCEDGKVLFLSDLRSENSISRPLKEYFEGWLRVVLEWDPLKRGCVYSDGKKSVIAFNMLRSILHRKVVSVYISFLNKNFWYEIEDECTMEQLALMISQDVRVFVDELLFLLPRGNCPDFKASAVQCWAEPDTEDWVLYVFRKFNTPFVAINPQIPPFVEQIIRDTKSKFSYEKRKRMWGQAVYFLRKEYSLALRLLRALKIFMSHLLTQNSVMYKTMSKISSELTRLAAKAEFFKASMNYDMERYEAQSKVNGGIESEMLSSSWKNGDAIIALVEIAQGKFYSMETKTSAINTKAIGLQQSPHVRCKEPGHLRELYDKALVTYHSLRKLPADERDSAAENMDMMKVVVSFLKHRERFQRELYLHLQKVTACNGEIKMQLEPLGCLLKEMAGITIQLEKAQRDRQSDMWTIVDNLCRTMKLLNSSQMNANKSPDFHANDQMHAATEETGNETHMLSTIVSRTMGETPALMNENFQLLNQLKEVVIDMSRMQESINSEYRSIDWSFAGTTAKKESHYASVKKKA